MTPIKIWPRIDAMAPRAAYRLGVALGATGALAGAVLGFLIAF